MASGKSPFFLRQAIFAGGDSLGACLAVGNHTKANFMREFYACHTPAVDPDDPDGTGVDGELDVNLEGPAMSARRRGHVRVPSAAPFGVRRNRRRRREPLGDRDLPRRWRRQRRGGDGRGNAASAAAARGRPTTGR